MAYTKRRRRRESFWNVNRICLLVGVITCGLVAALMVWGGYMQKGNIGDAIGGALCPLFFMMIPLVVLLGSALRQRRRPPAQAVVRPGVAASPGFGDVSISTEQPLPHVCIRCGAPTKRVTPLRYVGSHTEASPYDWSRVNPFVMIFLIWKFAFHVIMVKLWEMFEKRWKRRKAQAQGVVFRIPHCKGCASGNLIVQRHFDFHGRTMILEAHPEFRNRLGK